MDFNYYNQAKTYKYLLLIKNPDMHELSINLVGEVTNTKEKDWLIGSLDYQTINKKIGEKYKIKLFQFIEQFNIQIVVVSESAFTRFLFGSAATNLVGYTKTITGCNAEFVILPSYRQSFFRSDVKKLFDLGVKTFKALDNGLPAPLDTQINQYEIVKIKADIDHSQLKDIFKKLKNEPVLTVDIEGYSLAFSEARIATIAFAPSTSIAYSIQGHYKANKRWYKAFKEQLKYFLSTYKGTLVFHNATYDLKVIVYELWNKNNLFNPKGTTTGLRMLNNIDIVDTFLLAYVNLNSITKPGRGLKELAYEFMGDYAINVKDITKYSLKTVLGYNADDCIATFFYYEEVMKDLNRQYKNKLPQVIQVQHKAILPTIQAEMTGFCVNRKKGKRLSKTIKEQRKIFQERMNSLDAIRVLRKQMQQDILENKQSRSLTRIFNLDDIPLPTFNPQSGSQLAILLYKLLKLPVTKKTKGNAPATSTKVIQTLLTKEETKRLPKK